TPLQEFGKTNKSFYHLKRLHYFIHDFGSDLAQMVPSLPENLPKAADPSKLRYALRSVEKQGFLFFSNYQRYLDMPDRRNVQFAVTLSGEEIVFPDEPVTIPLKSLGIFPINMSIADATLAYASAQPLMRWQDGDVTRLVMVSLSGIKPQLCIEGIKKPAAQSCQVHREGEGWFVIPRDNRILQFTTEAGYKVEILFISEKESLNAWKIQIAGRRHLAVCPVELWQSGDYLKLRTLRSDPIRLRVYPATEQIFTCKDKQVKLEIEQGISVYTLPGNVLPKITVTSKPVDKIPPPDKDYPFKPAGPVRACSIQVGEISWDSVSDVLVRFKYIGDTARLYLNGSLVADNFWCKPNWEIGLKRWRKELAEPDTEFILVISPWKKGQEVFVQERPEVTEGLTAELLDVSAFAEQTFMLDMER
ncbi:MAG: hypothetical protein PVH77_11025, partial [Phycisphaerales bacterium]